VLFLYFLCIEIRVLHTDPTHKKASCADMNDQLSIQLPEHMGVADIAGKRWLTLIG
jgi:hypothetical protein